MALKRIALTVACTALLGACSTGTSEKYEEVTGEVKEVYCGATFATDRRCELEMTDGRTYVGGRNLRNINEGVSVTLTVYDFNKIEKIRYADKEVTE